MNQQDPQSYFTLQINKILNHNVHYKSTRSSILFYITTR